MLFKLKLEDFNSFLVLGGGGVSGLASATERVAGGG